MTPKHLTPSQKRVYDWIRRQDVMPTRQEIAHQFGFLQQTAQ